MLAQPYERELDFVYDRELAKKASETAKKDGKESFLYRADYDGGEIRCSAPTSEFTGACLLPVGKITDIHPQRDSFVYLDVGCWLDYSNSYCFGLVSGPDVYLCQYLPTGVSVLPYKFARVSGLSWQQVWPKFRNRSIRELFQELRSKLEPEGVAIAVLNYAKAPDPTERTLRDNHLYLLIGDLHLAPITWFYGKEELKKTAEKLVLPNVPSPRFLEACTKAPRWLQNSRAFQRKRYWNFGAYGLRLTDRKKRFNKADIFGDAGEELVRFLHALAKLRDSLKKRLHLINLGDMFELWMRRPYQFKPGRYKPRFRNHQRSADLVANWVVEIMLKNSEVLDAFRELNRAGLEEVKYIWGNHDAYLMRKQITEQFDQSALPPRDRYYKGLNGDLHAEHGHRFDSANFDNIKSSDGPFWTNLCYHVPVIRKGEERGRAAWDFLMGKPPLRDMIMMGAMLLYIGKRFHHNQRPFRIFVNAHTHAPGMRVISIRTYHPPEPPDVAARADAGVPGGVPDSGVRDASLPTLDSAN